MCDYSLQGIRNRLAEQGESLVVHRFQTGSKGLTCPLDLQQAKKPESWIAALKQFFSGSPEECAVCIPDGARLRLAGISPGIQRRCGVSAEEGVIFRQLSADDATYRDAVEFRNGQKIRLQELDEGQSCTVLALSSEDSAVEEYSSPYVLDSRTWSNRFPW
jgi:hypothetical protein